VLAYRLADPPPDPVPDHGIAQRPWHRKADAGTVRLGFADAKGGETGTGVAGALVVNSTKILGSQQADTFRKTSDGTTPRS